MAEVSDRYALPLLQTAQAQKEVTHNEAVTAIDTLLHLSVETAMLAVPPNAPVGGTGWIVGASSTGAWTGKTGQVAFWTEGGWRFTVPRQGCVAWLRDAQHFAVYTAAGWRDDGWPVAGLRIGARLALASAPTTVTVPVGGTVIDIETRAALAALQAALRAAAIVL
ncbi:DUF2793 domain-containing protein [Glacieibacterium sp.]|uniref:DUF2793 domain-containing protein n=1 Tax=Glacieibacterium sp. TaxID=2860237 RepID=UPI003AFFC47F